MRNSDNSYCEEFVTRPEKPKWKKYTKQVLFTKSQFQIEKITSTYLNDKYRAGGSSSCKVLQSSLIRFGQKEKLIRV